VFRTASLGACLVALLLFAPSALAQVGQPVGPWDGENPFNCENQDVGTGTDFPHPNADPFCVEFDKTNQNVTDFGIVDFLSQEPDRTAMAVPKCFYFQQDHWTGTVMQGQNPEVWHWDGRYFFDKAKGIGGVAIHNFRIGGQPADFTPYVPPDYRPYVYPGGGGGVIVTLETDPDPQCIAEVDTQKERRAVYSTRPAYPRCISPGGTVRGRHVGHVKLAETRKRIRKHLGKPGRKGHGVDRWCVVGGASLRVAYSHRLHRAKLILSNSRGYAIHGVGPGDSASSAKHSMRLRPAFKVKGTKVFEGPRKPRRRAFFGFRNGRVRWIAIANAHPSPRRTFRRAL
jgi:hypothetical protein